MRTYRPDVGDYMSDKAYKLYQQIKYKAEHAGTPADEADKCREQLKTLVERDKIPAEERTYRRPGESDTAFRQRVQRGQTKNSQQAPPKQDFSFSDFSAQRQRDFDLRDQQTQKYQESLRRQQAYQQQKKEEAMQAQAARLEMMRAQQQRARQHWQEQSDRLHNRQSYEPTGPRPKANTEQDTGLNWVFLFFLLTLLYYFFR